MTRINGQSQIHDMFVRSSRQAQDPEGDAIAEPSEQPATDQTSDALKSSVANKTDVFVGRMVGGTTLSTAFASGDATGAALEAVMVASKTMTKNPVMADNLAKSASMVSGAVAAANGDHFSAAMTAKSLLENSPRLSKLSVMADAVMIVTGDQKLEAAIQDVKNEARIVVSPSATTGDRWASGLKLAQHTENGVILSQQLAGASRGILGWLGKLPAFKGLIDGLRRFGSTLSAGPLGTVARKLGKLLPFLNLAALANSVRIAIDIWRDPRSSKTSKILVVGSVASGAVLFGASIATGGAALIPAAAAFGVASELGLMATRKRDLNEANTDRQMASYFANPAKGAMALGGAVIGTGKAIALGVQNIIRQLGDKLSGRSAAPEAKTAPSGRLGAVPKVN